MTREISSAATPFYKFVLPPLLVCLALFLGSIPDSHIGANPHRERRILVALMMVIACGAAVSGWRLRRVSVDGDSLRISNYFREIRVPLREVEAIAGGRWPNQQRITIVFRAQTEFGRKIVFQPQSVMLYPRQEHPAAEELRAIVRAG